MKALLTLVLAASVAAPAAAVEGKIIDNQDFVMTVGYKMWINNWSTWNFNSTTLGGTSGNNFPSFSMGGVANMIPFAIKYKNFFTTLTPMFTGDYLFPRYTDRSAAGISTIQFKVKRNEIDWNVGYMFIPQMGATVGLKSVTQKWRSSVNNSAFGATETWNWLGPTLGIVGSAPIGRGFSLYGNGVGGIMAVSVDPAPAATRNDSAAYEATELGVAWKARKAPISATFGYKYQRISTKMDISGLRDLRGQDVTSGYTLGVNVVF